MTLAALAIMVMAPTSAILIPLTAPCLLRKDPEVIDPENLGTDDTSDADGGVDVGVDFELSDKPGLSSEAL